LSVFVQQRPYQIRIDVKRRLLEPGECGGQVNQVELRSSAQNAESANER
jgi:hypothetical protein